MQQPPPHPHPQQQQQPQMNMMIPPIPASAITTEQIQKCLDENKTLILANLDNQNLGKLAECAEYQARLQKNLMFLAAIADFQPHAPTMPSQVPSQMLPQPAMQQGGQYMQYPQAMLPQQPPVGFPPKSPLQFNYQQMQEQQRQQLQHQQALQDQMGVRTGAYGGMQGIYTQGNFGGSSSGALPSTGGFPGGGLPSTGGFTGGANVPVPSTSGGDLGGSTSSPNAPEGKQDGAEAGSVDGQGNPAALNNSTEGEQSPMKGSEDTK